MVGLLTDIGNVRKLNEDYVGYHEDNQKKIYIVADGMGGHNAGEVASKMAVDSAIEYINSMDSIENLERVLSEAIQFSNKKVYEFSKTNSSLNGMGTTITACLIKDSNMVVANVGDSRCYVIDNKGIHQVTKDHSLVQQLVDNGSITIEEAAVHPNKNIITRALGTAPVVDIDIYTIDLKEIDRVILCTDGLSNSLTDLEIYEVVMKTSISDACDRLVNLSKERGGRDNITVIIFEGECKNDWDFARKQI
ncbi:Stp1/IreP family PP2C-type Ser/Thr phosphatase [Clostridium swellfunianum]|uniref:Stp1/IreP family PP2C-type Ser/Thr phosphatase n=1 Tax=Clostridium swellfunianum TaxID=1367462 RepID=UPI00202F764B|nr:Stp1/IreP family PP2C-type Ser/Thr phosphatase [Clostridium swellfunianum]MCM0648725.1 Stp1/IreP family PP2C-type Ser/Thr phosphatase [Clostridium swellfunianum]